jgi:hypothetical protein
VAAFLSRTRQRIAASKTFTARKCCSNKQRTQQRTDQETYDGHGIVAALPDVKVWDGAVLYDPQTEAKPADATISLNATSLHHLYISR